MFSSKNTSGSTATLQNGMFLVLVIFNNTVILCWGRYHSTYANTISFSIAFTKHVCITSNIERNTDTANYGYRYPHTVSLTGFKYTKNADWKGSWICIGI